jgi:hypothetical protein
MAKTKEKRVPFPSLMSKLGISDITSRPLNTGKTQGSKKEAEMQRFADPATLIKKRRNLQIQSENLMEKDLAMEPDSSIMRYVTEKGFFLDGQGKSYMQTGGKFYDAGEYDLDIHGLPVPLAQKQRRKLQIA